MNSINKCGGVMGDGDCIMVRGGLGVCVWGGGGGAGTVCVPACDCDKAWSRLEQAAELIDPSLPPPCSL
jgi:hypothetical protein